MGMDEEIRTIPADKKIIRFSIKADDTEENQRVHDAFKKFSEIETDNNYTLALRKLLEFWESDWRYEQLSYRIAEIESRISEPEKKEKEEVSF